MLAGMILAGGRRLKGIARTSMLMIRHCCALVDGPKNRQAYALATLMRVVGLSS